jgi:hypothetical protein
MTPHCPTWEIITSKCPRSLLVSKKVDEGKEVTRFIVIVYFNFHFTELDLPECLSHGMSREH